MLTLNWIGKEVVVNRWLELFKQAEAMVYMASDCWRNAV